MNLNSTCTLEKPKSSESKVAVKDLKYFGLTESPADFNISSIGGLYIPPKPDFIEVSQDSLIEILKKDYSHILSKKEQVYNEILGDLFMEKSFPDLDEAIKFISLVMGRFEGISNSICSDIIDNLCLYESMVKLTEKITCRFEVLSTDSCKKFHIDSVKSRLICTYAGPGTEIQLPYESNSFSFPSGSSLIIKGTKFPDFTPVFLHRSPVISILNKKRFVFIADCQ